MTDTKLVIWGHDAPTIDAIRTADSDANFLDAFIASSLGATYAARDEETQGWTLLNDAWCVAINPGACDTHDLDRDPAVRGYREYATGC